MTPGQGAALATVDAVAVAVASGERSALEVIESTLDAIASRDPRYNAFTLVTKERAVSEARAIDVMVASGAALPPLAGVPYAVKNLFDIAGVTTLAGGRVNANDVSASLDSTLVERMYAAGAILVGALNMDEHAYGFTTENTHYGATRNPHDLSRSAGGSSGGSAAAVAGGLVPVTLGSDTNGSIRVPSSLCGVFGLKPTYGRLPRSRTFPFVDSLDHLGPFASDANGLARVYDALQGHDALDHACAQRAVSRVYPPGKDETLRVGILDGYFAQWAGASAREAVALVARALGATTRVTWPDAERARAAAFVITAAEGGSLHRDRLRTRYDEYEPLSRDRLVAGALVPAAWVIEAQRMRGRALRSAVAMFADYDILLAAATPGPATLLGTETMVINDVEVPCRPSVGLLTQPISCIGLPVCCVPVWPSTCANLGLPVGVQLIAAPWREDLCLAAARRLEVAGVARCGGVAA